MILYPAIDLKDGQCVRLWQGRMDQATVFSGDPAGQARAFQAAGCKWLHVVDLDGAIEGRPVNTAAIESILEAVDLPVQFGGGMRDLACIETWLKKGVKRVVLGTAALRDPDLVRDACKRWHDHIAVGIDVKGGRVAVGGWVEGSHLTAAEIARRFEGDGVAAIVFTDIERDGTEQGLNVQATAALARRINVPVIASGGVGSLDHLAALKLVEDTGIEGVIVGRALYDGHLDLKAGLELLEG